MNCYRCGTTENLSVKKYQRGTITFICKACRRESFKGIKRYQKSKSQAVAEQTWRELAREKNGAIAKKYASNNRSK